MASERRKFYFLAPTRETPVNGPIKLGNIITLPRNADEPLNSPPIPTNRAVMEVFEHETEKYSVTIDKTMSGALGIWASFLTQILGLGGDVDGESGNADKEEWKCDTLKTFWFIPTPEYIAKSLPLRNSCSTIETGSSGPRST